MSMTVFPILKKNKFVLDILFLFMIFVSALLVVRPFFNEGYFKTDDGEWAIVRLAEMKSEIRDLQIPPRWSGFLNHGYGYPLFNFVYPLPYYFGLIPNALGFDLTQCIKILFVASVLSSGIGMYFVGKFLRDKGTGFIISLLYLSSPYRIVNLYSRGSLGEILSGGLFPFLVLFFLLFLKKGEGKYYALSSLFLFLLLLSHNVSALFFIPILGIISVCELLKNNRDRLPVIRRTFFVLVSGLILSSYFVIPALLEKKYIVLSVSPLTDISNYFLTVSSVFGISVSKFGSLFQIGIFQVFSFFLMIFAAIISVIRSQKSLKDKNTYSAGILSLALILYIFMMTSASRMLWSLPLISSVDFPWRLLGPISFLISFVIVFSVPSKVVKVPLILFSIFSLITIIPNASVNNYFIKNDTYYTSNDATTTSADELMPIWVSEKPTERYQAKIEFLNGYGPVTIEYQRSNYLKATVDAGINSQILVNAIYYPGWEYKINGVITEPVLYEGKGISLFSIPAGKSTIEGKLTETPLRLISDLITLVSGISVFLLAVLWERYKKIF